MGWMSVRLTDVDCGDRRVAVVNNLSSDLTLLNHQPRYNNERSRQVEGQRLW